MSKSHSVGVCIVCVCVCVCVWPGLHQTYMWSCCSDSQHGGQFGDKVLLQVEASLPDVVTAVDHHGDVHLTVYTHTHKQTHTQMNTWWTYCLHDVLFYMSLFILFAFYLFILYMNVFLLILTFICLIFVLQCFCFLFVIQQEAYMGFYSINLFCKSFQIWKSLCTHTRKTQ